MYYQPEPVKGADEGLVSNGEPKTPMGRLVLELLEYVDHQLPRDMPTSTAYYGVPRVTAITLTLSQTEGDEASKLAAAAKAAAAHQAEAIAAAEAAAQVSHLGSAEGRGARVARRAADVAQQRLA